MSREAMQMALEALELYQSKSSVQMFDDAVKALRQALEAEQEPVAWLKTWSDGSLTVLKTKSHAFADHELEPLYTAPPKREWVGLTDEEVAQGLKESWVTEQAWQSAVWWAEAKLKEKNG